MTDVLPSRCSSAPERLPLVCRLVTGTAELDAHHRIRREVFVHEQGLFDRDDRDDRDGDAATLHVLGEVGGRPAGAVRLYPLDGTGLWKGDRLAVRRQHRHAGLGGPLVQLAVATAAQRGGHRMQACVQVANATFFLALGWTAVGGPFELLGAAHQRMTIGL